MFFKRKDGQIDKSVDIFETRRNRYFSYGDNIYSTC